MTEGYTLPVEQLEQWTAELRRNAAETARLAAEREEILAKIHAVRLLFGSRAVPQSLAHLADETLQRSTVPAPRAGLAMRAGQPTFVSFIQDQLENSEAGLTMKELSEALKGSELRERAIANPNAIYTAVGRLVERNVAFKDGKLIYSKMAYQRMTSGQVPKRVVGEDDRSVPSLILSVLRAADKAMTSGEILDGVRAMDARVAEKLNARSQVGYTAIARLAASEQIEKVGDRYRIKREAPEGHVEIDPLSLFD